jgi:glutaredoxin
MKELIFVKTGCPHKTKEKTTAATKTNKVVDEGQAHNIELLSETCAQHRARWEASIHHSRREG